MRLARWSTLAMLAIGACTTHAAEHPDKKTKKHKKVSAGNTAVDVEQGAGALTPYVAFAWDGSTATLSNVQPMPDFSQLFSDPVAMAGTMNAIPAGRRVGLGFCVTAPMWGVDALTEADGAATQSPWCDNGVKATQAAFGDWFAQYTAAGGPQPDFVALDDEHDFSTWTASDPAIDAIEADPRFSAVAELFSVTGAKSQCFSIPWDGAMNALKNADLSLAMNGLITNFSNYGDALVPTDLIGVAQDYNGWPVSGFTTSGTFQSPAFYGWIGQVAWKGRNDGSDPDFANDPLATVIFEADQAKVYAQADKPILPWFAFRSYTGETGGYPIYIANSPYWDEQVFHVLMSAGSTNCLLWNPNQTPDDTTALNDDLAELQKKCGNADTITPLGHDAVPYGSPVMASGVKAGARRVWRVSVATVSPKKQIVKVKLPGTTAVSSITIPAGAAGTWVVRQ